MLKSGGNRDERGGTFSHLSGPAMPMSASYDVDAHPAFHHLGEEDGFPDDEYDNIWWIHEVFAATERKLVLQLREIEVASIEAIQRYFYRLGMAGAKLMIGTSDDVVLVLYLKKGIRIDIDGVRDLADGIGCLRFLPTRRLVDEPHFVWVGESAIGGALCHPLL